MAGDSPISVKMAKKEMMTVDNGQLFRNHSGESNVRGQKLPGHNPSEYNDSAVFGYGCIEYSRKKLLFNIVRHFCFFFN